MTGEGGTTVTQAVSQLLTEALRLSEEERGELVARLLESLDNGAEEDVEAAWGAEIQQRLGEIDRGEVPLVPWSEVRRMILEEGKDAGNS
jgi:putative addiction module component (TIGR02574 family)